MPVGAVQSNASRCDARDRAYSSLFYSNTLRQITRLIDVAASAVRDVVREKLQRDDFQDREQKLVGLWYWDVLVGVFLKVRVIAQSQGHEDPVARLHFLHIVQHLL